MNATEFEQALLKEKQEHRLASWRKWGEKMTMLRSIHAEIMDKKQALIRATARQDSLEQAVIL